MATPANRVPVRIARGSKANLDTAIAAGDLKEGEICYATDENGIYVVEGGVLTQAGADLASTSIDALSDVDTTTATPADGQVLTWVDANSQWEPVDAAAAPVSSVNGQTGVVSLGIQDMDDFTAEVNGLTVFEYTNKTNASSGGAGAWSYSGGLFLNDQDASGEDISAILPIGSSGQTLYFQWFDGTTTQDWASATVSEVVVYLTGARKATIDTTNFVGDFYYNGATGVRISAENPSPAATDVVAFNGTDYNLKRLASVATSGSYNDLADQPTLVTTIDSLSDVDTSTTPPTDGQALVWVDANSQWEPGTVSGGGGGAVDSVNGQTGVVSLGIQDMDDCELSAPSYQFSVVYNQNPDAQGEARLIDSSGGQGYSVSLYITDENGTDIRSQVSSLPSTGSIGLSITDDNFLAYNYNQIKALRADGFDALPDYSNAVRFIIYSPTDQPLSLLGQAVDYTGSLYVALSAGPWQLAEGDILRWNDTDSKFKPTQLATVATSGSYNNLADQPTLVTAIDGLSDVDTSTTSPSDGQALVWVAANSRWEPGTISGGGGAVDSVNGQTGVVSLGVQDMDDYGTGSAFPYTYEPTCCGVSPGEFSFSGNVLAVNGRDSDGVSHVAYMTATQGQTISIWYQVGTVITEIPSLTVSWLNSGAGTEVWRLEGTLPGDISSATGFFWQEPAQLLDGGILQWNDADQQFQPAQLATVATTGSYNDLADQPTIPAAAPVDSVNGQTGAVSLSVSDLSDITAPQLHRWNVNISGSNVICSSTDGSYAATVSGPNNNIMIMSVDADGNDVSTWFSSWTGTDSLSVYIDGVLVATQQLSFLTYESGFCRNVIRFSSNTIFNAIAAAGASAVLTIQNNTSPQFAGGVPSNGDVLVYNSTNSQYEPSSDYVSLSTLKTEVAASTDFADFQSRIAAL